jgi:hypothetical protein
MASATLVISLEFAQLRGVKPRRVDSVTRIGLALLTRLFDWHDAVVIGAAENDHPLAPYGMAIVLAIQVQTWSTADSSRTAGADS